MMMGPAKRDRHGRGMRRPLPSKLFKHGTRTSFFDAVVSETCEYLRETFSELADLNYRIEDVPLVEPGENLKRYSTRPATMTITLYRLPIERLGKRRIPDPRIHIEQAVLAAAASLIDKDPWELVHPEN